MGRNLNVIDRQIEANIIMEREGVARQESLRHGSELPTKIGRFGLVGYFTDETVATTTAQAIFDEVALHDSHALLEVRPVLTEEEMWDQELLTGMHAAVWVLKERLGADHDVTAIPSSHPIIPILPDKPSNRERAAEINLAKIVQELDSLPLMIGDENRELSVGIVGIATSTLNTELVGKLSRRTQDKSPYLDSGEILVMEFQKV